MLCEHGQFDSVYYPGDSKTPLAAAAVVSQESRFAIRAMVRA